MFQTDTIAAIATALSPSGIGIIRISGEDSIGVADKIFSSKSNMKLSDAKSHTIHYGTICDNGEMIDEVMIMLMKAPHTFTRENTIEIDCHGGVYVMNRILETVIKNGARLAEPGEFTKRAFLNGRIDLTKAEAIMDLIHSKNELARKNSVIQLRGKVEEKIRSLRETILYEIAFIESALDDPEHISLEGYTERLMQTSNSVIEELEQLVKSSDSGRIVKDGINTVIVGKPNVGKSSLLNLLTGEERAIVTSIAGTTRDTLEESILLDGIYLNIIDTAGIHFTDDEVEKIGVKKAKDSLCKADLVIYMIDSSVALDENDREIMKLIQGKEVIAILNKSDLEPIVNIESLLIEGKDIFTKDYVLSISAKTQYGLENLTKKIKDMFFCGEIDFDSEVVISNLRQKESISEALESMKLVRQSLQESLPEDFYSIDLMSAYSSLGAVIGEEVGDDLVNEIFSKFCMGK